MCHRQRRPKLEARSPVLYTQVDVVGHAVVTIHKNKKKQRGRAGSDEPPKKKEFLCVGMLKSALALPWLPWLPWLAPGSPGAPLWLPWFAPGSPGTPGAALTHSSSGGPTCRSRGPPTYSGLPIGPKRTGQPSPLGSRRDAAAAPWCHAADSAAFGHPGPPTPRRS